MLILFNNTFSSQIITRRSKQSSDGSLYNDIDAHVVRRALKLAIGYNNGAHSR
jgi:hypothetical protein